MKTETIIKAVYRCKSCGMLFGRTVRRIEGEITSGPVPESGKSIRGALGCVLDAAGESVRRESEYMKMRIGEVQYRIPPHAPAVLHECQTGRIGSLVLGASEFVRYSFFRAEVEEKTDGDR